MKKISFIIVVLGSLSFSFLHAQDVSSIKRVAILPAIVNLIDNTKKFTIEDIYKTELNTGFYIQNNIEPWFKEKHKKFDGSFEFQNTNTTNELLFAEKRSLNQFKNLSSDSLLKILNVDILLFCNAHLSCKITKLDPVDVTNAIINPSILNSFLVVAGTPNFSHTLKMNIGFNETNKNNPYWQNEFGPYINGLQKLNSITDRALKTVSNHLKK
jgi:hypothetical protein